MKIVQVISKHSDFSYYGEPLRSKTITTFVSDELSPEEVEIVKETARRELEHYPVNVHPFA